MPWAKSRPLCPNQAKVVSSPIIIISTTPISIRPLAYHPISNASITTINTILPTITTSSTTPFKLSALAGSGCQLLSENVLCPTHPRYDQTIPLTPTATIIRTVMALSNQFSFHFFKISFFLSFAFSLLLSNNPMIDFIYLFVIFSEHT